jgi:hypothetical protein
MKLGLAQIQLALAFAAAGAVGCSASSNSKGKETIPDADAGAQSPEDEVANEPPHALGMITLGELHTSGSGSSVPIVGAAFLPSAKAAAKCTKKVAGCEVPIVAKCGSDTASGCGEDEVCTLDDKCSPKCTRACTASCDSGEECYFSTPTTAACRKRESFDAGALAFAGTTTPITLFPPYALEGAGKGAPFLAGAQLEVQASGATVAGFEKFDEKFVATTFLQTSPRLDKIPRSAIFGKGNVPIGWAPGSDAIIVSVTGPAGAATCKADDVAGTFEIPRAVIDAVSGDTGTPTLSFSVSRQKKDVKKDLHTKGTLSTSVVEPVGYLELVTMSTESASYQGCYQGQTMCSDTCVDTRSSETDCGTCGHACKSGGYCENGKCSNEQTAATCDDCSVSAQSGVCKTQFAACSADPDCGAAEACVGACNGDTTCINKCRTDHPTGVTKLVALYNCFCDTACVTECAAQCN